MHESSTYNRKKPESLAEAVFWGGYTAQLETRRPTVEGPECFEKGLGFRVSTWYTSRFVGLGFRV